jgi:DNA-binding SARP family transcriptional activator
MSAPLAIYLLGVPRVERDGMSCPPPRGRKAWALLAYLLTTESAPSRPWLAELLFADAEDPLNALSWNLGQLRRLLSSGASVGGETVNLRLPPGAFVDIHALTGGTWLQALAIPGLGRGLLEGMSFASSPAFEVWLLIELRRLLAAAEDVLREAARSRLAVGDAERAIELAGRLVAVNGLDEDSQELLIRAYSAAGDRAAAERQRDACIALFQSELGTDPGPAVMRAAEAQALRESTQYVPNRAAIEARLEAALAAQDAGASEAAIASLRAAVTDADDIGDRELQGRALLALGSALVHGVRGRDGEGAGMLHQAIKVVEETKANAVAAQAHRELGYVDMLRGRYERSWRWLQQATALAAEHPAEAAWAHAVHGAALTDVGRHGDAFNELRQALQLGEMAHDLAVQTWARAFVGRIICYGANWWRPATRSSGHSRSHASCAGPRLFRCLSRSSPTSTLPKGGSTPPARRTSTRTNSLCNSAIRAGRGSPPGASAWWPRAGATMKRESGGSRWPG